jgi:hypothetical protein
MNQDQINRTKEWTAKFDQLAEDLENTQDTSNVDPAILAATIAAAKSMADDLRDQIKNS